MLVLILGLCVAVADQVTKHIVRLTFDVGESRPVLDGLFDLTFVRNTGAAWGLLGGQNASLTILSVIMLVVMVVFRRSFLSNTWEHRVALGLMIGGIVGNLMDRLRLGWVTDFLDFHWRAHHWPAFNVADAAICVGVGIYVLSALWLAGHPLHESRLKGMSNGSAGAEKAADAPK
ncbi:MAG: signal peptidase II [Verrucomicrobiota bacterium]